MNIVRSSKCSIAFSTQKKRKELESILSEYGKVVNHFIGLFWTDMPPKAKLLKGIVNSPTTWLTARLRKVAAREAIDMILAAKERWKDKPSKLVKPVHKGKRMYVSCTIAALEMPKKASSFDGWLHLASIGNKSILDLPIRFHRHFNRMLKKGKRLNSYIVTTDYVQFAFEIETPSNKTEGKAIGIDTGINALASTSTGKQYGRDIKGMIERVKRCEHGSNGQQKARRALKQRIDEVAKEVLKDNPGADMIVVEGLKDLGKNSKVKRLLTKNVRRSIGAWNWRYWLGRLEQNCQTNRVRFWSVAPAYTSQRCSACGHTDRANRVGEMFKCQSCGYVGNADLNAALNILGRFATGQHGDGWVSLAVPALSCPSVDTVPVTN